MNEASPGQPAQVTAQLTHVFPIRVYYEDTDAAGVVYYANYLRFAERARTEFLREIGFGQAQALEEFGVVFAVRRCTADYAKPAFLDQALEMHTRIVEIAGASFGMEQTVFRDGELLVSMDLRLVCMTEAGKAARIPEPIRAKMAGYLVETS